MRISRRYLFRTCYIARESAAIIWVQPKIKSGFGGGNNSQWKKGKASGLLWLAIVGVGKLDVRAFSVINLGVYLAISGPELEAGAKKQ